MSVHHVRPQVAFRVALYASTAACCIASAPVFAQAALPPPPIYPNVDDNGVDVTSGTFAFTVEEASIGVQGQGIKLVRSWSRGGWNDIGSMNLYQRVESGITVFYVVIGDRSLRFAKDGASFVSSKADGSSLVLNNATYTFTSSEGIRYEFSNPISFTPGIPCTKMIADRCYLIRKIAEPSGFLQTFTWETVARCSDLSCTTTKASSRLKTVVTNTGYRLTFNYPVASFTGLYPPIGWAQRSSATLTNLTSAGTVVATVTYSNSTAPYNIDGLTGPDGGIWSFTYGASGLTGITRPGSATNNITINYGTNGAVSGVTRDGITTTYTYSTSGSSATMVITDAAGKQRTIVSDLTIGRPVTVTDELGNSTTYQYDSNGRLTRKTMPEGNYLELTYDARGNVLSQRSVAKPGSGASDIVSAAAYPASCTNPVTCNKPFSTTDPKGAVTNFEYDPSHGGVTSITFPAAAPGEVRPQTRYSYGQFQAFYDLGSGSIVASGSSIFRLTGQSKCRSSAACVGTADEVRTVIDYGPQIAGVGNNLLPRTVTHMAGDSSMSSTVAVDYDPVGNLVSSDGPLTGAVDVTSYRYDSARRVTAEVTPDPDGGGPLRRRITSYIWRPDGQISSVSTGTVDADGSSNAQTLQTVSSSYDTNSRKIEERLDAGGATWAVTHYSYDALGRSMCNAVRMDPGQWGGQTDACVPQTSGGNGPDRVSRVEYDDTGRLTRRWSAWGTAEQSAETTTAYTPNGQVASVTGPENSVTAYTWDGFDRLSRTTYAAPGSPGLINPADYEQLGYDVSGNVISRRLRDGQTLFYSYDALNRRVLDDNPNTNVTEPDVVYQYDLLGRLTNASDQNGWYNALTYDPLGNITGQSSNVSFNTMVYDAAGRLIRQTWHDGFFVTYGYDTTGAMTVIRENDGAVLASFTYDDLGRRISLSRGNGVNTAYGYDSASNLANLTHDLTGVTWDQTYSFSYNAARQIISRTASNDLYAWTDHYDVDRSYDPNSLNQLRSAGTTQLGYDSRGNLSFSNGSTYQYNTRNHLNYGPSGSLYYRNPAGLLGQGENANYDHVLGHLSLETGSAGYRRYVWGPGADEPLIWYEGTGTGDKRWLVADERGSVVAVTDTSGQALAINAYDEYGIPSSGNQGRFQYTGQIWLPALGLYDYKARMYSPTLGRFMQTDPTGYNDGLNWYDYVGSDPVNSIDPSGEEGDDVIVVVAKRSHRPKINDDSTGGSAHQGARTTGFSGRGGGIGTGYSPKPQSGQVYAAKMSEEEQESAADEDDKICRMVGTRECWESAAERRAARARGRPVPPLRTGVKGSWSGRNIAAGAGAVAIIGGVICLLAEPCGAVVGGSAVLGGGAVLLGN